MSWADRRSGTEGCQTFAWLRLPIKPSRREDSIGDVQALVVAVEERNNMMIPVTF
jgi:hypothetical protein